MAEQQDAPADQLFEQLSFDDNRHVASLAGEHDAHLLIVERAFGVRIDPRGNVLNISGPAPQRAAAAAVLKRLYQRLAAGQPVTVEDVRAATKYSDGEVSGGETHGPAIKTPKRLVSPRTPAQRRYLDALASADLNFGVGPAGTGKTYLAVAHAVGLYQSGAVERIILSRPALEAGERIGFLPGDMKEKVDPYLRPLYDALHDMLHADYIERRIAGGEFEIAPLGFMRGRTLARAAVILDEAQNATVAQTKMFLTRLGEGARMVLTGDPSQSDLPRGEISGLADAVTLLAGVEGVKISTFTAADVVRHPLVGRIIDAYDARDAGKRQ
ncbi:MAG TPA: phosphate starvation-inducible protein PhoH [Parvularcula sp.]|nr:phosphate starvation-inducible protein PhoH [Parvularcula sp.]